MLRIFKTMKNHGTGKEHIKEILHRFFFDIPDGRKTNAEEVSQPDGLLNWREQTKIRHGASRIYLLGWTVR